MVQVADLARLWLWLWLWLAAVALIGPLAWELPYAAGAEGRKEERKEKKKERKKIPAFLTGSCHDTSFATLFPVHAFMGLFCRGLLVVVTFGHTCSTWKFLSKGWNPTNSNDNARSLSQ